MPKSTKASFSHLPNDSISDIFKYLPDQEFPAVSLVCPLWNQISHSKAILESRYNHQKTPSENKPYILARMFLSNDPDINTAASKMFQEEYESLIKEMFAQLKNKKMFKLKITHSAFVSTLNNTISSRMDISDIFNFSQHFTKAFQHTLQPSTNKLKPLTFKKNQRSLTKEEVEKLTRLQKTMSLLLKKHPIGSCLVYILIQEIKDLFDPKKLNRKAVLNHLEEHKNTLSNLFFLNALPSKLIDDNKTFSFLQSLNLATIVKARFKTNDATRQLQAKQNNVFIRNLPELNKFKSNFNNYFTPLEKAIENMSLSDNAHTQKTLSFFTHKKIQRFSLSAIKAQQEQITQLCKITTLSSENWTGQAKTIADTKLNQLTEPQENHTKHPTAKKHRNHHASQNRQKQKKTSLKHR